jgi:adenylate kinase
MSIVITGNPGVGKHTITKKISEILNFPIVDINIVAKDSGLFEKNEETNDVDTQKLTKILRERKLNEKIVVGHLAPYVLEKNQVEIIIILRRNPYDLQLVYNERDYSEIKIKENIGSEILGIIMHDAIEKFEEKAFQVNISERNIQQVVERILEIISKKEGNEEVDWLDLVTKNNDLEKFFTH